MRRIEERTDIGFTAKWRRAQEYAAHIPSPLEHYVRNRDKATHILLVDALFTHVSGKDTAVMIAYDTGLGVVDFVIDCTENKTAYSYLFQRLMDQAGYKPLCVVSDGHFSLLPIIRERKLPHQRCTNHLLRELKRKLVRHGEEVVGRDRILYSRIKWIFHTRTIEDLPERIEYFRTMVAPLFPDKTPALRRFWRIVSDATLHLSFFNEKVPPTTNRIENLNGQVKQRLKTMRGMKSEQSLHNLLKILFYFRKYK